METQAQRRVIREQKRMDDLQAEHDAIEARGQLEDQPIELFRGSLAVKQCAIHSAYMDLCRAKFMLECEEKMKNV